LRPLRELVGLGALLHDAGKLKSRIENPEKTDDPFHERWGRVFLEEKLKGFEVFQGGLYDGTLKEVCKKLNFSGDCGKVSPIGVVLAAFYHHDLAGAGDYGIFARIFKEADQVAAAEKGGEDGALWRLRPVFSGITALFPPPRETYFYPLKPLEVDRETSSEGLKEFIFPRKGENLPPPKEDYEKLFNAFLEAFEGPFARGETSLPRLTSKVYHLVYKYLWSVPAFARGDVSLFDHSRSVAAVSTSLLTEENLNALREGEEPLLLLVEGDLSGIQRFLFGITNYRGAAKRLRARSFFLALLPELVATLILENLGYNPTVNTLYCGGGKFQILVGFEKDIEKKLKEFQKKAEEVLLKEFGGRLGLVLTAERLKLSELKDYREVVKRLRQRAVNDKKRKFQTTLPEAEKLANTDIEEALKEGETQLCPSCRWEVVTEGEELCKWCKTFERVGAQLPKVKFVAFSRQNYSPLVEKRAHFELGELGFIYLLSEENFKLLKELKRNAKLYHAGGETPAAPLKEEVRVFLLNGTRLEEEGDLTGFRFICQTTPVVENPAPWESLTTDSEERAEEGAILPFTLLQKLSEGDEKLGYLKADVDNLGLVFMAGIENYSFSRVSTLSRMLDLFFSLYADRKTADLKGELLRDYPEEKKKLLESVKSPVYTVYSGGDDLFLIGTWNAALRAGIELRKDFELYTCSNPNFGISAGLGLFKGTYPLRLAADRTDRLEAVAKSKVSPNGKKDKVALFGMAISWKSLEEAFDEAKGVARAIKERQVSRSFVYRLYARLRAVKENTKTEAQRKEELLRFIPYFYYQLARNLRDQKLRERFEKVFIDPSTEEVVNLPRALLFSALVLMLTRD